MSKSIINILTLIFITQIGCDLLSVRNAEPPDKPRGTFQFAVTHEDLIVNLINSVKEKNSQNYIACLTDSAFTNISFSFLPSAGIGAVHPVLLNNWSRTEEEQYFNNLIIRTPIESQLNLILSESQSIFQADTVIYSAKYNFIVPNFSSNETNNFQGELKFKMIRDSRFGWTIFNWQDIKNSDSPTWSELKGQLTY
ncbi:MAG: hypothetical protein KF721_08680 [Ignavibacteriaceae bacterium]|nr:hypothetical protein [Ignavibacteriaceae bacterium]